MCCREQQVDRFVGHKLKAKVHSSCIAVTASLMKNSWSVSSKQPPLLHPVLHVILPVLLSSHQWFSLLFSSPSLISSFLLISSLHVLSCLPCSHCFLHHSSLPFPFFLLLSPPFSFLCFSHPASLQSFLSPLLVDLVALSPPNSSPRCLFYPHYS